MKVTLNGDFRFSKVVTFVLNVNVMSSIIFPFYVAVVSVDLPVNFTHSIDTLFKYCMALTLKTQSCVAGIISPLLRGSYLQHDSASAIAAVRVVN